MSMDQMRNTWGYESIESKDSKQYNFIQQKEEGSFPFFVRALNQINYTPPLFKPREAFSGMAAESGSDKNRRQTFSSCFPCLAEPADLKSGLKIVFSM